MKTVLTIAGSDCSGGAGVQADLKTMAAHGVFGMSVIVSVVAENTARVIDIQDISPRMIEEQIDAVFEDIVPDAVKIGMLSSPECMKAVAGKLAQYKPAHIVIDPVMFAKNGDPLMDPASVGALIETVLPFAEVLTPNVPEAQYLADMEIRTPEDMEEAARRIFGARELSAAEASDISYGRRISPSGDGSVVKRSVHASADESGAVQHASVEGIVAGFAPDGTLVALLENKKQRGKVQAAPVLVFEANRSFN